MHIGYPVGSCANHGPAPIPQGGGWVTAAGATAALARRSAEAPA
ncbi:MAG: hypothetical protein ACM3XS_03945 [Bacteroidota bacterium]